MPRYQVLRLKEDHPVMGAARSADAAEHGDSKHDGASGRLSDSEIVDTQCRSPLDRVFCFAPYQNAVEIADLLNSTAIPTGAKFKSY